MKYLITEDKMQGAIEQFLKKWFPEVVTVSFRTKSGMLGSRNNEIIQRKVIEVTTDPHNIISGGKSTNYKNIFELKKSIMDGLDAMFGLDLIIYGSKWEVVVYYVKRVEV